jgi:hypothetical protein
VKPTLFNKVYSRTPKAISGTIEDLCKRISPDQAARFVEVHPEQDGQINECFVNVLSKVSRDGGAILYGWKISEWLGVFSEAEHHAVWLSDDKEIDVTPNITGDRRILFLPDPERAYDIDTGRRLLNIHHSSGRFASIQVLLDVLEKWQRYLEEHSDREKISISQQAAFAMNYEREAAFIEVFADLKRTMHPAERCFCGSRMSFARCCSAKIDLR